MGPIPPTFLVARGSGGLPAQHRLLLDVDLFEMRWASRCECLSCKCKQLYLLFCDSLLLQALLQ